MLRRFKCIIFDKDGTLYCSRLMTDRWKSSIRHGIFSIPTTSSTKKLKAWNNVNEYLDSHFAHATWDKLTTQITSQVSNAIGENVGITAKRVDTWVPKYIPQMIFPGVKDLFQQIPHKKALFTSDNRVNTLELVNRDNLIFDEIVCGDDVLEGKPNPEGVLYILDNLNVTGEDTCIVGDTMADISLKNSAGLGGAIGVKTLHENISGADLMVDSISDLRHHL